MPEGKETGGIDPEVQNQRHKPQMRPRKNKKKGKKQCHSKKPSIREKRNGMKKNRRASKN